MRSVEVVAKKGFVGISRSRWGGINRHALIWIDISCRKHFGYVFFVTFFTLFFVTFFLVTFFVFLVEIYVPIYYDDPKPLKLEPNQHYSTPQNRPNSTPPTEPIQTQPNPPYPTHHPPHTTHPPHPPHLPPRKYYAPLPSPPDHHHHHHPTHPAYPTYHPEGTMHLCLRPPTTTTTHHHTIQPPTTTPPNHPPTHPFGTSACFITDVFVVLLKIINEWKASIAKDRRVFGITRDWITAALLNILGSETCTVCEGRCRLMAAWLGGEENASESRQRKIKEKTGQG